MSTRYIIHHTGKSGDGPLEYEDGTIIEFGIPFHSNTLTTELLFSHSEKFIIIQVQAEGDVDPDASVLAHVVQYDHSDIHSRLHAIDSQDDHVGVSSPDEGTLLDMDEFGLPRNSGKKPDDFEDAGAVREHEELYDHSGIGVGAHVHANLDQLVHITDGLHDQKTNNPHNITPAQIGAEPADPSIQSHLLNSVIHTNQVEKDYWNAKLDSFGYTAENVALKNQPNGYAGLDGTGKIPVGLIPLAAGDPALIEVTSNDTQSITIGQPVYMSGNMLVKRAAAVDSVHSNVIGLASETLGISGTGYVRGYGYLTATTIEWDAILADGSSGGF